MKLSNLNMNVLLEDENIFFELPKMNKLQYFWWNLRLYNFNIIDTIKNL